MDGAMMEIGPYRVNEDGTLRIQEGGWDEFASVLFIDNPVGTGFSYVDGDALVHDLAEMADQIIIFLEKWFGIFKEYSRHDVSAIALLQDGFLWPRVILIQRSRYTSQANLTQANIFHTSQPQY